MGGVVGDEQRSMMSAWRDGTTNGMRIHGSEGCLSSSAHERQAGDLLPGRDLETMCLNDFFISVQIMVGHVRLPT